jgi:hypothetical protein
MAKLAMGCIPGGYSIPKRSICSPTCSGVSKSIGPAGVSVTGWPRQRELAPLPGMIHARKSAESLENLNYEEDIKVILSDPNKFFQTTRVKTRETFWSRDKIHQFVNLVTFEAILRVLNLALLGNLPMFLC